MSGNDKTPGAGLVTVGTTQIIFSKYDNTNFVASGVQFFRANGGYRMTS